MRPTLAASSLCRHIGACLLGSINLARWSRPRSRTQRGSTEPGSKPASPSPCAFSTTSSMSRATHYCSSGAKRKRKRRIGLGVTGLADALIFCGLRYGSPAAAQQAAHWMATIQKAAYAASAELAAEKGAFPLYDARSFLARPNVVDCPRRCARQSATMASATAASRRLHRPARSRLLAGNVSSGIEPVFDFAYTRRVLDRDSTTHDETVEDYAFASWKRMHGPDAPLPRPSYAPAISTPASTSRCRRRCSRTSTAPSPRPSIAAENITFEAFKAVYLEAYRLGLKGCTTYRPNAVTGAVLQSSSSTAAVCPHPTKRYVERLSWRSRQPPRGKRRSSTCAAARAGGGSVGLHLQAQVAGERSRHLRHHQRYRA